MTYIVKIAPRARRQILALPTKIRDRVESELDGLANSPRPDGCKKLKGQEAYRIRVGDYRIIYTVEDNVLTVTVIKVGHRGDIYE